MSERLMKKRFRYVVCALVCFFTFTAFNAFVPSSVNGAVSDDSLIDGRNYSGNWATADI